MAWHLGGGMKPWELEQLSLADRRDCLDALDWVIQQENEAIEAAAKKK
jgi:hypothetical protein